MCQPNLPDSNFTSAHPEWVQLIERQALNALKTAFKNYAVVVEAASKDNRSTWSQCISDSQCLGTTEADQGHVVRVGGDLNPSSFGVTAGSWLTPPPGFFVGASNVYYYPIMTNFTVGSKPN